MTTRITRKPTVADSHLSFIDNPLIRQIYASRGVRSEQELQTQVQALAHFKTLKGISAALALLTEALSDELTIVIVGDFDADGATSTALMMLSLQKMGAKKVSYLVPNRFDFGYGLSPEIVAVAHQQGAQLIITVDNGISSIEGVEKAKSLGIKVLITDHHLAGEILPDANAIVNPNQPGCQFLSKNLAGVGVAFYVLLALRSHLKQRDWFIQQRLPEPNLATFLDIVALGTVADVVPLDENNRILVHQGLQRIRSAKARPGILALFDVAGKSLENIVSSDLGFVLGPRLNAAGRLDDMALGIECLLAEDMSSARRMAVELDALNRERREIQTSMQSQAMEALKNLDLTGTDGKTGIVVYKSDFHQGVIGVVAGKIKDEFNRPTIAFAHQDDENLKGSARSISGLHIRDLLEEINARYPNLIDKFGGHAMAAGLSIKTSALTGFTAAFEQIAEEWMADMDCDSQVLSDGELDDRYLSLDFASRIKQAGPWGQGFPEPIFDGQFQLVQHKLLGGKHLKMLLRHPQGQLLDAIAFNTDYSAWPSEISEVDKVHVAYKLDINEFRGKTNLQLMVEVVNPI